MAGEFAKRAMRSFLLGAVFQALDRKPVKRGSRSSFVCFVIAVSAIIALAKALKVSADELLGLKSPRVERVHDDAETKRLWKRFQKVTALPERDQRAVICLINSLAAVGAARKSSSLGEANAG